MPDAGHVDNPGEADAAAGAPCPVDRDPWPRTVSSFAKASALAECFVSHDTVRVTRGWESGGDLREGAGLQFAAPSADVDLRPAPDEALTEWASELRRALVEQLPLAPSHVAIVLSRADVVETVVRTTGQVISLSRRVAYARILLGPDPTRPRWTRPAPLRTDGEQLPAEWSRALSREVAGWDPAFPEISSGALFFPSLPVVVDAFACADLLRSAAARWLERGAPAGESVASPVIDVDDPGFAFPAAAGDRDAEGEPVRPLAVVRDGRLWGRPRTLAEERLGLGRSTGSAVRESWRTPAGPGWRSLVIRDRGGGSAPDECAVLTRVLFLPGGAVLGAGHYRKRGRPCARWGPAPAPDAQWWLLRVSRLIGPGITDGAGIPVHAPAALVEDPGP